MEASKLPLFTYFSNLRNNPKWGIKLLLTLILVVLSTILSSFMIDYKTLLDGVSVSEAELKQVKLFGQIGIFFTGIIGIAFSFVIFLVIFKIMRSKANVKTIFSGTLSYTLITGVVGLIVMTVQWLSGLSITDYSITSLDIFDKGNKVLRAFDLQILLQAYVFTIMLIGVGRLTKKSATIWGVIYLLLSMGFGLLGAILS